MIQGGVLSPPPYGPYQGGKAINNISHPFLPTSLLSFNFNDLSQLQNGSRKSSLWAELVHLGEQRISFFGGLLSQYKLYSLAEIISFIVECNQKMACCDICGAVFTFQKNMFRHVIMTHNTDDPQLNAPTVKCEQCDYEGSHTKFLYHKRTKHREVPITRKMHLMGFVISPLIPVAAAGFF